MARQLKDCLALAERKGWPVLQTFIDNDVSASTGRVRPQYAAMMTALAEGRLDALVCWDVDRLTRTPRELEDVVDLAERKGVALASVGGEIDLATPQGRLTARIKGSVAKHETEQLSRRVKAKMDERAETGATHGRIAYGWRREQVLDDQGRRLGSRDVLHPEQAAVLREAAGALLAGDSLRHIVAVLNDRGEVTLGDVPWTIVTLRRMLLRERTGGLRRHRGEIVGQGDWEAILDPDTYSRVVALLSDPARRTNPGNSAVKYLLTGLAKCGVCGNPIRVLAGNPDKGRAKDSYVCHEKFHVRRSRPDVDHLISQLIIGRLAMPDAAAALSPGDGAQVQQARDKAAALRARLDLAADSYAEGEIDGRQLARITSKLRPEMEQWEHAARAASTTPDLLDLATPDIAKRWPTLPLARQRAVIDLLLDIRIDPTTRKGGNNIFDPNSVRITWKSS